MIVTGIMVNIDRSANDVWTFWRYWNDISAMSDTASFGVMAYGSVISLLEVMVRVPFYAIAKILEEQDRRREERRRREEEQERMIAETRKEGLEQGLERGIELALNNPRLEKYPELREQIRKDIEDAMGNGQ